MKPTGRAGLSSLLSYEGETMMKILLIMTGGTIGSTDRNGVIDIDEEITPHVIKLIEAHFKQVELDVIPLMNILSENLCAEDLNKLAKALLTTDFSRYSGVIVTCGSDNLAYLSAFVGLLTYRRTCHAVIVAADKPAFEPDSNAYDNIRTAVELLAGFSEGPCVPYRDSSGMRIHSAFDIRQADLSQDFFSFSGKYNTLTGKHYNKSLDVALDDDYVEQTIPDVFDAQRLPVVGDDVLLIHPYPLLDYSALNTDGKKAVLHMLYHSGTLDSERLVPWMKEHPDIPVYLASLRSGRKLYRTAKDAIEAGAVPLFDIAPECAYMKLLLACAQDEMSIREFMEG